VGEAPGRVSLEKERRFTGPAGLLIRRAFSAVGHSRYRELEDLFYFTDAVKCHPALDGNPGANRSPTPQEVRSCAPYLVRELTALRPTVIVAFGKRAAAAVDGALSECSQTPRPELIAFPHPSPRNQRTILKSYPSLAAFERSITDVFRDLIRRLEGRPRRGSSSVMPKRTLLK
jgi:uracil-DNA glycosylase